MLWVCLILHSIFSRFFNPSVSKKKKWNRCWMVKQEWMNTLRIHPLVKLLEFYQTGSYVWVQELKRTLVLLFLLPWNEATANEPANGWTNEQPPMNGMQEKCVRERSVMNIAGKKKITSFRSDVVYGRETWKRMRKKRDRKKELKEWMSERVNEWVSEHTGTEKKKKTTNVREGKRAIDD